MSAPGAAPPLPPGAKRTAAAFSGSSMSKSPPVATHSASNHASYTSLRTRTCSLHSGSSTAVASTVPCAAHAADASSSESGRTRTHSVSS
jgi:hypothetical protein